MGSAYGEKRSLELQPFHFSPVNAAGAAVFQSQSVSKLFQPLEAFECVFHRRTPLCCDRLDSELFHDRSGTENSPSLPAQPDLSCHFSVLRSLVFLFVLLSSISGGGSLINGNTESNLPVIH